MIPPTKTPNRSPIWDYGVRMSDNSWEEGKEGHNANQPQKWACLANQSCRENKTVISIHANANSKATQHLQEMHGVVSNHSKAKKETKDKENEKVKNEEEESSGLKTSNPKRFHLLSFVKHLIIGCLLPFSVGEKQDAHIFFRQNCK